MLKAYLIVVLKGIAMGVANVIPGVSGGTIALIAGIFERIINAIKHLFTPKSLKLFFTGKWKLWAEYTDIFFLIALGIGVLIAIVSVARLFEYLFAYYPIHIWAFFFGLVLASVWFVGKTIQKWNIGVIVLFILGAAIAAGMALLKPMSENQGFIYLFICGAIAICSMILPGVSGSFVLVLMGNYELIMIESVNNFNVEVLIPVALGAGIGLLGFSYILSWIFRKFRNQTISLLTGFMFGSLLIIWPWKEAVWRLTESGTFILSRSGDKIVERYIWMLPEKFDVQTISAIGFIVIGIIVIAITERLAGKKTE